MNLFWYKVFWRIFGNIMIYNGLRIQGLSWGVPVVTGDMSMGRGIVLAALCIPLAARRGALAKSDAAAAPQPAALYTDLM